MPGENLLPTAAIYGWRRVYRDRTGGAAILKQHLRGQELWLEIREPIVNIYTDRVDGKRTGNIKGRWFFVNFELASDTQRIAFDFDYAYTQAGDFDAFLQNIFMGKYLRESYKAAKKGASPCI